MASGLWDDKNYSRCLEPLEAMDGAVPELACARTWRGGPLVATWGREMRWRPCEPCLQGLLSHETVSEQLRWACVGIANGHSELEAGVSVRAWRQVVFVEELILT